MPAAVQETSDGTASLGQQESNGNDVGANHRLRFAMVCASNMNRSMEAHKVLKGAGFLVESFGVGARVKLPGPDKNHPNVYSFGTPYTTIYEDLMSKDPVLYDKNGLLDMLDRNIKIKLAPQRWQESWEIFDVVITFEGRVMEAVEECLNSRPAEQMVPCLVINLEVKDSHKEAQIAGPQALKLAQMLETSAAAAGGDWAQGLEQILDAFQQETGRRPTYSICWC